jgi:hypothetical protein
MTKIREWLQGKKTYLVCASGIIAALTGWAEGSLSGNALFLAVLTALGMAAQKAGQERNK